MEQLHAELLNLATVIIVALVGWVTRSLTKYLKKKGILKSLENNKEIAKMAVNAVEQMHATKLFGREKLQLAMDESRKIMFKRGIKISDDELKLVIESVVQEVKREAVKASK